MHGMTFALRYSRHDDHWCHVVVEMHTNLKRQNVKNKLSLVTDFAVF